MITIAWLMLVLAGPLLPQAGNAAQATNDGASPSAPVFREAFTLKLHTNDGEYKEQFDKVPYVADNVVYIFAGESFGVNVTLNGDDITGISYQKDRGKADIAFKFAQGNKSMMLLIIKSNLKRRLFLDTLMTVPQKKGVYKTSILPVEPGLENFESWPHPIVQLALRNFRFTSKAAN